jgi:hypothetical protein
MLSMKCEFSHQLIIKMLLLTRRHLWSLRQSLYGKVSIKFVTSDTV